MDSRRRIAALTLVILIALSGVAPVGSAAGYTNGIPTNESIYLFGTGQQDYEYIDDSRYRADYTINHSQVFSESELDSMEPPTGDNPREILNQSTPVFDTPRENAEIWNQNVFPAGESVDRKTSIYPIHYSQIGYDDDADEYSIWANGGMKTDLKNHQEAVCPDHGPYENEAGLISAYSNIDELEKSAIVYSTVEDDDGLIRPNDSINEIENGYGVRTDRYINQTDTIRVRSDYRFGLPFDYTCTYFPSSDTISVDHSFTLLNHQTSEWTVEEHTDKDASHGEGNEIVSKSYSSGKKGLEAKIEVSEDTKKLTSKVTIEASYEEKIVTKSRLEDGGTTQSTSYDTHNFEVDTYDDINVRVQQLDDSSVTTYQHVEGHTTSVIRAPHPYAGYRIGNVSQNNDDGLFDWLPFVGDNAEEENNDGEKTNLIETGWGVFHAKDRTYDHVEHHGPTAAGELYNNMPNRTQANVDPLIRTYAFPTGHPPEPNKSTEEAITPAMIEPGDTMRPRRSGIRYKMRPPPRFNYAHGEESIYPEEPFDRDHIEPDVFMDSSYYNHTQIHVEHRRNVNDTDVKFYHLGNTSEPAAIIPAEATTKEPLYDTRIEVLGKKYNATDENKVFVKLSWQAPENADEDYLDLYGDLMVEQKNNTFKEFSMEAPPTPGFSSANTTVKTNKTGYIEIYYKPDRWDLADGRANDAAREYEEITTKVIPFVHGISANPLVTLIRWLFEVLVRLFPILIIIYQARKIREYVFSWRTSDGN